MSDFFDGSQVDETEANKFDSLPDGHYTVMVKSCEKKDSQNTPGCKYFSTQYEVVKGEHAGRMIFSTFVTEHSSEKARNIGRAKMKLLCLAAAGKPTISTAHDLMQKPFVIKIKTTKDKATGQESTNVVDLKPLDGVVSSPTAKPATTATVQKHDGINPASIPF